MSGATPRTSAGVGAGVGAAIDRGLQFLQAAVAADGAWPCREYDNRELVGPWTEESPPFVAGLGLLALEACDSPAAERLRTRTRGFLHAGVEYPGVWRYRFYLLPDLDDTAICSLAAQPHLWLLLGRNVDHLLSFRDERGRFLTWMETPDGPSAVYQGADSVVNANVIAYLGDRPETRAAQCWLHGLVEAPRGHDLALRYYPFPLDLYAALARASDRAPPVFASLRATLAERILACRDAGGAFGDALRTAQALTALDRLDAAGDTAVVQAAVQRLLQAQHADGGWPECLAWLGHPGSTFGFGSAALTTACCIEALARVARR